MNHIKNIGYILQCDIDKAGHIKSCTDYFNKQEPFDIIISKGVLKHVKYKASLFRAFHKPLIHNGVLLINDWLSEYDYKDLLKSTVLK